MRVLLVHNRYRSDGGEERSVSEIAALLERRGDSVEVLERQSRSVGRVTAARGLLSGGLDPEEVAGAVRRLRAEVVHAHNLHPLLGWRALAAARSAGARTIVHLHNFRLFCAIGIAYRDGAPCFRCRGRHTTPGLRLRCRGSLPEAAVYSIALHRQQPGLIACADRFVCVSRASADRLIELGLPASRAEVLPNFVPAAGFASESRAGEGEYALIAGRLVEEKGFDTAIAAAIEAGVPLLVAGDGPDMARLRSLAAGDVRFLGRLPEQELAAVRARAAVVLAPSRWEEPCPYTVIDAMAAGVPVLSSEFGGLPELVGEDSVLPALDPAAWAAALASLWGDPARRQACGQAALERARARFGEDQYYQRLLELYG